MAIDSIKWAASHVHREVTYMVTLPFSKWGNSRSWKPHRWDIYGISNHMLLMLWKCTFKCLNQVLLEIYIFLKVLSHQDKPFLKERGAPETYHLLQGMWYITWWRTHLYNSGYRSGTTSLICVVLCWIIVIFVSFAGYPINY